MVNYTCNECDFTTINKSNYIKHNQTSKHIKRLNESKQHLIYAPQNAPKRPKTPQNGKAIE